MAGPNPVPRVGSSRRVCAAPLLGLLAAGAAVALSAGCSSDTPRDPDGGSSDLGGPSCKTASYTMVSTCKDVVGKSFPCAGQNHVIPSDAGIAYSHNPPHSGPHWPIWETTPGEHKSPIPRGKWIHNLEHGAVVLLYSCPSGCDAGLKVLRDALAQRPKKSLLLTPDPELSSPRFAAVSWTWVYRTDAPKLDTLLCFIDQHEGNGPEDIPMR